MNKRCARCEKVVYSIEELKCLDKVWHKGCFKCQECGMTLSMKTYKGFNKLPYCEAHIPKAKATTVAETPEMKRLAENTKNQSNVQYHAEFEKNKAKFTQVADDPETRRIQQNSKIISNASYHGDLEKKAWMESKRSDQDSQEDIKISGDDGYGQQESSSTHHIPLTQPQSYSSQQPQQNYHSYHHSTGNHANYRNSNMPPPTASNPSYSSSAPNNQSSAQSYYHHHQSYSHPNHQTSSSYYHRQTTVQQQQPSPAVQQHGYQHYHQNAYQDSNHNNSTYPAARGNQTLVYSSNTGPVQHAPTSKIGSIADYDPVNDQHGSLTQQKKMSQGYSNAGGGYHHQQANYQAQRNRMYQDSNQQHSHVIQGNGTQMGRQNYGMQPQQHQHKINAPPTHLGRCFRAIYDYDAVDSDEVSFRDGDLLINCASIDEGWMMGTVQRTGKMGMLPANYVERAA